MAVRTGLSKKPSFYLQQFLILIGRPFFRLFFYLGLFCLRLLGLLKLIFFWLGQSVLLFFKKGVWPLVRQAPKQIKKATFSLGKISSLFVLPKMKLPKMKTRIQLSWDAVSSYGAVLPRTARCGAAALRQLADRLAAGVIKPPKIIFPKPKISRKVIFLVLVSGILLSLSLFFYLEILKDLPRPDKLITRDQAVTTKIYDRQGRLLYKIYRNQNRTLVRLEEVPLYLRQATVAIEDAEFYSHRGFSLRGVTRAVRKLLQRGRIEGGSTITQQLVKNALLSPERTLQRKIKELILAIQVELYFSKDEILQMYLNEVGYGGAAYGVEEASRTYFGKGVKDLTLPEAALLAGLPASPTRYSPFGAHPELAKARQEEVLRRMVAERFLTPTQAEEALAQDIYLAPQKTDILAPHFVMYVKQLLVASYGEKMVEEGGLEVITSLDLDLQEKAQKTVWEEVAKLKSLRITNGAALVNNPKTGEILAMVGSKDYFDQEQGNFNVTTAARQPGSAIKPVTYSLALNLGFTPATILSDTPITYRLPGQAPYSPRNYDGRFRGNIPLRVALASSYNVPAVKVLSAIGVERLIEQGEKMGITTWNDPSRFGLSLTLGGGEVRMTDMAVVYGILANQGVKVPLNPILQVKNYKGEILEDRDRDRDRVIKEEIAYILTDILADNHARTPAFGPFSVLHIPGKKVAVKTGTSNNLKDNWTIGYTPNFVVATWVGNNDSSPMSYVASGVTGASPIWRKITDFLLANYPYEEPQKPEGLIEVEICQLTGTLACGACPSTRFELFLPGTQPQYACRDEEIRKLLEKKTTPTP